MTSALSMGADLDLGSFFLRNAKPEQLAALPGAVNNGRIVFLTSDGRFYLGFQGAWVPMGQNVTALEGVTPAALRARGSHTGTQAAETIEDLKTVVVTYRLDEFAAPTAPVSMGSQRITSVSNAVGANDAVNKGQLDAVAAVANAAASGIALKPAARFVTVVNDSLSGLAARNGVTPVAGDRVLVPAQTTASANGIYVAASGAWTRATDADQTGELAPGTLIAVREGTTGADTLWALVSDTAITVGTTAQNWAMILNGGAAEVIVAGNGLQKSAATLSILLAPNSGLISDGTGLRIDTTVVGRKASGVLASGAPPISFSHNLGTEDVDVTVRRTSDGQVVAVPWWPTGTSSVAIGFGTTTAANSHRIHVTG